MSDITQRDIEELRRLAEDGRKLTCPGSPYFILWGITIATASATTYASMIGWVTLPIAYLWIGAIALGWVGSMIIGFAERNDPLGHTLVNRMTGAIWIANGIAISVIFAGLVLTDTGPGAIMVPVAHAVSGGTFAIMAALSRIRWLYLVAFAMWASSIACFYLMAVPEIVLVAAGVALMICIVGLVLARQARHA